MTVFPERIVEQPPASDLHSRENPALKATGVEIEQRAVIEHRRVSTRFEPMSQQLLMCARDRSVVASSRNLRLITSWTIFEKISRPSPLRVLC